MDAGSVATCWASGLFFPAPADICSSVTLLVCDLVRPAFLLCLQALMCVTSVILPRLDSDCTYYRSRADTVAAPAVCIGGRGAGDVR